MLTAIYAGSIWQNEWSNILTIPIAFFVLGILLRLFAIKALGNFYSHQVRVIDNHQVVQNGPYRWVRHPAYSGMLLAELGFVLYFANPFALTAFFLLLLPSIIFRIRVEELTLYSKIKGYDSYAQNHKRLIPKVW
ncbi:methyltransferase family protein [Pseudomonas aeruginosa]|uniref:methyltransferase family protein n=1 Tax=Pseudomonas aeruginosa TaxID=287 RepID=UPI004046F296